MEPTTLIAVIGSLVGILAFGGLAYFLFGGAKAGSNQQGAGIRDMMVGSRTAVSDFGEDVNPLDIRAEDLLKKKGSKVGKKDEDISAKLFQAGFFSKKDVENFKKFQVIALIASTFLFAAGIFLITKQVNLAALGLVLGIGIGYMLPRAWLERTIRGRQDEMLYYLPLVIEQVSIGVSSSLDVGPCISNIITMASERDSHNAVTEMFVHVEKLVRSGLSFEESLQEVGDAVGNSDVKHTFMFLSQCSKHGGEISKQLQELADSVMIQRQVHIEGKIAALPVKATGPLSMVFAGFLLILFAGLFVQILKAFN